MTTPPWGHKPPPEPWIPPHIWEQNGQGEPLSLDVVHSDELGTIAVITDKDGNLLATGAVSPERTIDGITVVDESYTWRKT